METKKGEKMDRRVRKTRAQLRAGLARLMQQKNIKEITVKELVDEIDIKDLRDFQFMGHSKIEFKPLPPQFDLENVSKKRNHMLFDDLRQNSK